ncbi:MAG: STAS domain-containing protein [Treponema sp.]|jgi:anti-anti-sigma factor|nr:STAS domain-containing protein [Treponema sp.]
MEIVKTLSEGKTVLSVNGMLSAATTQEFSAAVDEALGESNALVLDFKDLSYLASAGLRVLVGAQKKLNASGGSLSLLNVRKEVMEVFEVTGLDDIFDIKQGL